MVYMGEGLSMKVSETPYEIHEALINRGWKEDDDIDPITAISEWSIWDLGCARWGTSAVHYYEMMRKG